MLFSLEAFGCHNTATLESYDFEKKPHILPITTMSGPDIYVEYKKDRVILMNYLMETRSLITTLTVVYAASLLLNSLEISRKLYQIYMNSFVSKKKSKKSKKELHGKSADTESREPSGECSSTSSDRTSTQCEQIGPSS
jgi:hypothetical protein